MVQLKRIWWSSHISKTTAGVPDCDICMRNVDSECRVLTENRSLGNVLLEPHAAHTVDGETNQYIHTQETECQYAGKTSTNGSTSDFE